MSLGPESGDISVEKKIRRSQHITYVQKEKKCKKYLLDW